MLIVKIKGFSFKLKNPIWRYRMSHRHFWQLSSPVLPLKNGGSGQCFHCACGAMKVKTVRIKKIRLGIQSRRLK